ncbi:WD repeat-containing protein 7 [Eumeta japonica]|uniref:WD repeat-containing protein 7 n=1 Tax=Eumeta variegata TaxID=151549 RepID=A0A4C2A4Q9_EUMVA|nr:WD repeat-containing protein 7 [Eumeta japonica]
MCSDADKLVPSMTYGLPLTPQADSCRTARRTHAHRHRQAGGVHHDDGTRWRAARRRRRRAPYHALQRGRAEVLRGVELLIDRMHNGVAELLVEVHTAHMLPDIQRIQQIHNPNNAFMLNTLDESRKRRLTEFQELFTCPQVMDIILHCVDQSHLKSKGLNEVSHCPATRRIAVGSHTGQLALYELRAGRCQSLAAHNGPVTACAFSPDGRYLVSYATADNRLSFWQSTAGMFGLGAAQTLREVLQHRAHGGRGEAQPARLARLVWTNSRTVTLMLADGSGPVQRLNGSKGLSTDENRTLRSRITRVALSLYFYIVYLL